MPTAVTVTKEQLLNDFPEQSWEDIARAMDECDIDYSKESWTTAERKKLATHYKREIKALAKAPTLGEITKTAKKYGIDVETLKAAAHTFTSVKHLVLFAEALKDEQDKALIQNAAKRFVALKGMESETADLKTKLKDILARESPDIAKLENLMGLNVGSDFQDLNNWFADKPEVEEGEESDDNETDVEAPQRSEAEQDFLSDLHSLVGSINI